MRFELEIAPLDLGLTLGCGQNFRFRAQPDGTWSGVLGEHHLVLRQRGTKIEGTATPGGKNVDELVLDLLRAQDDVDKIQRKLSRDFVLALGIRSMRGLRIVKLDEWECLISYVLATYANIPRIAKMVEALATSFGHRIYQGAYSFPDRRRLARASVKELKECGLGYRAEYVKAICDTVDEDMLDQMNRLSYTYLRKDLIEMPGVGDKVADCVSLFGFGRLEAFPIDIWIERAMARLYKQKGSYRKLREFATERFGEYAGYAQEYLYHNERMHAREAACAFSE